MCLMTSLQEDLCSVFVQYCTPVSCRLPIFPANVKYTEDKLLRASSSSGIEKHAPACQPNVSSCSIAAAL